MLKEKRQYVNAQERKFNSYRKSFALCYFIGLVFSAQELFSTQKIIFDFLPLPKDHYSTEEDKSNYDEKVNKNAEAGIGITWGGHYLITKKGEPVVIEKLSSSKDVVSVMIIPSSQIDVDVERKTVETRKTSEQASSSGVMFTFSKKSKDGKSFLEVSQSSVSSGQKIDYDTVIILKDPRNVFLASTSPVLQAEGSEDFKLQSMYIDTLRDDPVDISWFDKIQPKTRTKKIVVPAANSKNSSKVTVSIEVNKGDEVVIKPSPSGKETPAGS